MLHLLLLTFKLFKHRIADYNNVSQLKGLRVMKNFENLQSIYDENLRESVIPFWVAHSPDRVNGGFFSCLDADGKVFDTKKYIWLQGRALWMFCRLYNSYKKAQEYLEFQPHGRGQAVFLSAKGLRSGFLYARLFGVF